MPRIQEFLAYLAKDLEAEPPRIQPVPLDIILRAKALVEGVSVDLDAMLSDDEQ